MDESALIPDLNTGMLVDSSTGQFIGGPGDLGTAAADAVTSAENWITWGALAIVAVIAILIVKRL